MGGGASNAWFPPLSPLCRYNVPSFSEQRLVIKSSNDMDFEKPFTRIYLLCTCSDLSLYGQKRVQNEKICQLSFLKKYHAVFSKGKLELCRYLIQGCFQVTCRQTKNLRFPFRQTTHSWAGFPPTLRVWGPIPVLFTFEIEDSVMVSIILQIIW